MEDKLRAVFVQEMIREIEKYAVETTDNSLETKEEYQDTNEKIEDSIKLNVSEDLERKEAEQNKSMIELVSDSPWYEEDNPIYKYENIKQVMSEYFDLRWDFGMDNAKDDEDLNGQFHKLAMNDIKIKTPVCNVEVDLFNMENHFAKTNKLSVKKNLEFENVKIDNIIGDFSKITLTEDTNEKPIYNAGVDITKLEKLFGTQEILYLKESLEFEHNSVQSSPKSANESPIIPDLELDYDNIYENLATASDIEKHLQLLYRPFTCVVDVNCRFNLYELAFLLDDTRYEPAHHPALYLRLRNPSAELKIYSGGKITSSALTAYSARKALLKVIQMVEDLAYKTDIVSFCKNIVHASFCLPFKVDLELLSEMHSELVSGNSESRPFVTYKIEDTAIRFAIFPNGYILVLHSTQHSETRAAIAGFLPILAQFKNGYLTHTEKYGSPCGDISFKLLWERKIEDDKEGILLYS